MPTMPGHHANRAQGPECLLDKLSRSQISKFTSHLTHIQEKPDVGRRNAGGNLVRVFLNVVGNEPVVLLSAELGKIAPGADSGAPQEEAGLFRNLGLRQESGTLQPF